MPSPRIIPSIDQLRSRKEVVALETRFGPEATLSALREQAAILRARLEAGESAADPGDSLAGARPETRDEAAAWLVASAARRLASAFTASLRPVINATGVIIHTNLGRAPLAEAALRRVAEIGRGYSNLEYDLEAGGRGRRDVHAEALLVTLTGAEAALVVNNNAAATLLVLAAVARGREVIISRGELVEIGGGFRVPEIMAQSGAVLREVGTTNRTRVSDYAAAIGDRTAMILRVHRSNFRIEGFTESPDPGELIALGRRFSVPVAEDLGGGNLHELADRNAPSARQPDRSPDTGARSLDDEPTVRDSVRAGYDLVCFSGDKLLGGPQAGVVVGRADLLARVRRHPLMRAFRVDKLTYAALEATLIEHAAGRASATVPVLAMLSAPVEQIDARARVLADRLRAILGVRASVVDGYSTVGGGSAPGSALPTSLVALAVGHLAADALEAALRAAPTPIVARIEDDRVVLDLRTVFPSQDAELAELLVSLLTA